MIIAVDTGGTKTLIAAFDHDGTQSDNRRFATPRDFSKYLKEVVAAIKPMAANSQLDAIVVAIPGIIRNGVAINCANLGWENVPVKEALADHFPNTPIFIENDANLGGLGETRMLDSIPTCSLYVTISTGIGAGIIEHGKIDESMSGSEAGHMVLEFQENLQTWESFASGKAVFNTYQKLGSEITDPAVWQEISQRIARGFFALIPAIQPDVIIIGGSMGTHFGKYEQPLLESLRANIPNYLKLPEFITAKHPEEAVIHGCYYHAIDQIATE